MSTPAKHLRYRPLRAPREDRTALVEPPWGEVPALVTANLERRARYDYDFHGLPLGELARQAREELVAAAIRWTSSYRDVSGERREPGGGIFLAGHQPQLFHPGVWLKNFALGTLARQHGALAINLVIDSDTIKSSTLRVPGGSTSAPQVALVPFDRSGPIVPFEERRVLDRATFLAFGQRAARQIAPLVSDPLIGQYWLLAIERSREVDNLGACLAQARNRLEQQWGLAALEVPQSQVCRLPAFARFAVHLLARLPRLRTAYNDAVAEYRRLHGIRGTAHPVPDLAAEGEWMEAPFWIWTGDDPRRRRLFVRGERRRMVLSDRQQVEVALPCSEDGDIQRAVGRLVELPGEGVRLRSRALITTLWARLVLGDLFLHGIGGAKYDQVTDAVIERFFGLAPPGFVVLSGTLLLPVPRERPTAAEVRAIDRRLRELTWHPETAVGQTTCLGRCRELAELVAAKARWIGTPQTAQNASARCREIRRINAALQPWVAGEREWLVVRRAAIAAALRADAVLAWREYGFCLYPETSLRDFLEGLLPNGG